MNKYMDLFSDRKKYADDVINAFLPEKEEYLEQLINAMEYSVVVGGKRLRPIFLDCTYRLFGGEGRTAKPFMAAMEYLHTYSLVHDDMPEIDNDLLRRGNPTTHAKYGASTALLAGDGLLHWSFETALMAYAMCDDDSKNVIEALNVFAHKSGPFGMLGGQSVDVLFTGENPDLCRITYIYKLKTCALIEASLMIGAILAGADNDSVKILEEVGRCVGEAFQIKDDFLDMYGEESTIGKPTGSDEKNQKTTYVTLVGPDKAVNDIEALSNKAVGLVRSLTVKNESEREFLIHIINMLVNRNI